MGKRETIPLQRLGSIVQSRPGLIVGPNLTLGSGVWPRILDLLNATASVEPTSEEEVQRVLRREIDQVPKNPLLDALATVRWKSVLSASLDSRFEDALRDQVEAKQHSEAVSVLMDRHQAPPRSLVVYKLLGQADRAQYATKSAYRRRRPQWRPRLQVFVEELKGAPVMCFGMSDSAEVLHDLLAELGDLRVGPPSAYVFTAEDSLNNDSSLLDLSGGCRLLTVPAPLGQLCASLKNSHRLKLTPTNATTKQAAAAAAMSDFEDVAVVLKHHLKPNIEKKEKQRLLDLLFSPSALNWSPYAYNLDLARTVTTELAKTIRSMVSINAKNRAFMLVGSAGSGKTTALKRVAFDLATHGFDTLWLRPSLYQDTGKRLSQFFKAFATATPPSSSPLILFVDDPVDISGLSVREVANSARSAGFNNISLVAAVRRSDWATTKHVDILGGLELEVERDLADHFDPKELEALADSLLQWEITSTPSEAKVEVDRIRAVATVDVLTTLHALLPETRNALHSSIKAEYFRLGDRSAYERVVVGLASATTQTLKKAYEIVAVCDHYRTSIPIEVMVAALEIYWNEWTLAVADGPAFGLLYPVDSPDGSSFSYRTRNNIVTRVIVDAVNGGNLGRSGELRTLRSILAACTGTQPIYREFALSIFLSGLFKTLDYESGLALFDCAETALPIPDRTLLHQKGLWVKNRGNDPLAAITILKNALKTPPYPYATKEERDEHINTSLAACVNDALVKGLVAADTAKDDGLGFLARSRSPGFENPNAVHAKANFVFNLVNRLPSDQIGDMYHSMADVLAELDALLLSSPTLDSMDSREDESTEMLQEVRFKLLGARGDETQISVEAESIWAANRNQTGFVLLARRRTQVAEAANRGTDYNDVYQFINDLISKVRIAGESPSPELYESKLHLLYRWRIHGRASKKVASPLDWKEVLDSAVGASGSTKRGGDPLTRYILAISYAQLGKWTEAMAQFNSLKTLGIAPRSNWAHRDWLISEGGLPRKVQGTMRGGGTQMFLWVEDLDQGFRVERRDEWPREGEIAFAYISLRYSGPIAVANLS